MKEEILNIADKLRNGEITTDEAQSLLLVLFDVSGSCSADELEEMKHLAHEGLPDDCVKGWDEVKFCENRQGDGNACKWCSNYR
jgi:hypothetical protein